jgi:membrane protein DedA with SNARE-associated domain
LTLADFISQYGYLAVFIGTLVEGETLVVLAGLAAARGYLSLPMVIAVASLGSFISYQFCFQLGRRTGPRILANIPNSAAAAARVRAVAERYPALVIIGIHFLYGVRTVGLFVIGMSGVGGWRFLFLNMIGSVIWATAIAVAGYIFGNALTAVLGDLEGHDKALFVGLFVLAAAIWLVFRLRRRAAAR